MVEMIFGGLKRYFVDLSVGSFIPGSRSSARKTTIFYDKTIFDDSVENVLDKVDSKSFEETDVEEVITRKSMSALEIDATTDFNVNFVSNVIKIPTEGLGTFVGGISNEPIRINISGLVTNVTEDKVKTLKMIRDKKLPVKVFTYKFENSILGDYKKIDSKNLDDFFYINNMFFKDTGRKNTTEISLSLSEIRTFDSIEEEFSFDKAKEIVKVGGIVEETEYALSFSWFERFKSLGGKNVWTPYKGG